MIPGTVKTIEDYAFCFCESLNKVTLDEGIEYLGYWCLDGSKITDLTIADTVIKMDGIIRDTKIEIPNTVQYIGEEAFESKYHRQNEIDIIYIPDSVTEIGQSAFPNVKIYGSANSIIEEYCNNNGIEFVIMN